MSKYALKEMRFHFFPNICIMNEETGCEAAAYLISLCEINVNAIQEFPLVVKILESFDLLDKLIGLSVGPVDLMYVAFGSR
jgi:hypothetical protein